MAGAPFDTACGSRRIRRRAWGDALLRIVTRNTVDCGNRVSFSGDQASRPARPATRAVSAAAPAVRPVSCLPIGEQQA